LQRDIINTCGCYYTRYTQIYNTSQPCLNLTQYDCIQRVSSTFEQDKCTSECPLECDSVKYEYSLSSMSFPSQSFYDKFKSDVNYFSSLESSYGVNLSTIERYKNYFVMGTLSLFGVYRNNPIAQVYFNRFDISNRRLAGHVL